MKTRTHKRSVENARSSMSPEQISRAKNNRCKERSAARKAQNLQMMEEQRKNRPSAKQQLANLDFRLGKGEGAKKERAKLAKLIK